MNRIKRIAIWGPPSSGKSTLSKKLEKFYNLPVYHSDEIFETNWRKIPKKIVQKKTENIINFEKWIIDGNFAEQREKVLNFAQMVIILNLPYHILFSRHIKRTVSAYTRFQLSSTKYYHKIQYKTNKQVLDQELIGGLKTIIQFKKNYYGYLIKLGKLNNQSNKYIIIENQNIILSN
ncbi:MAG: Shikimate kinase [Candidatus Heimdallarchaeota archaeon LC_3]|nr:MAG: Shikimate kinase [Candidatus Heimdallarchaeota archaeon LC_3]